MCCLCWDDCTVAVCLSAQWIRLSVHRQLKTFLFQSVYGHQRTEWWFCDVPSVFGRGRNTNGLVIVTVIDSTKLPWHIGMSSVLWRCWLGVRKGIRPIKIWLMRCWRGYLLEPSVVSLHMVQLMTLLAHHVCFSKIKNGLSFWCRLTWVVPDKGS